MKRHIRHLSSEEEKLWRQVLRSIKPLPGHALLPENPLPLQSKTDPGEKPQLETKSFSITKKAASYLPSPPPLIPFERHLMRELRKGSNKIDARIDLHGMCQEEAYYALLSFLRRAQANGSRLVLVVTGKGSTVSYVNDLFNERGVLRRLVPHWLGLISMRSVVAGFSAAGREHGGEGALYVRLRRAGKYREMG